MSWFTDVCGEFVDLMQEIGRFLGLVGPSGFKVATDILTQVEQGGTTPQQVAATAADLAAFTNAVISAATAAKVATGTSNASVITAADIPGATTN